MSWFVEKLGPLPPGTMTVQNFGQSAKRLLEKSGVSAPTVEGRLTERSEFHVIPHGAAPASAPTEAPDKKKKGWF